MTCIFDEFEIKKECDQNSPLQCRACLSVGRKLVSTVKYLDLFKNLMLDHIDSNAMCHDNVQFCWECYAQLRKIALFCVQINKANDMVRSGQSYIYGTLSNLTTVIINDSYPHTIYINDDNISSVIKRDNGNSYEVNEKSGNVEKAAGQNQHDFDAKDVDNNIDKNITDDNLANDFDDNIDEIIHDDDDKLNNGDDEDDDSDTVVKEETKNKNNKENKKKSKWAIKKALMNKKPKYKMLSQNELNIDDIFKRVMDVNADCQFEKSNACKDEENKCKECVEVFNNKEILTKHDNVLHGTVNMQCCGCNVDKKRDLTDSHKMNVYECSICKILCLEDNKRIHLTEKHKEVYLCLRCDLKFECKQEFFKHYKDWHEKFICEYCGVSFKMKYCIKNHIRKQHSPFECKACCKKFARYNGLWLHNKLRHGPPAPPAYCVECDKQYPDVYRYRWHLANSARHKPKRKVKIPCSGCDKVFSKKIYMTNHYELVHLKQYRYRCEPCDKNFIRNADLVKHHRRVHEGILPPRNKICYVCGRGFTTNKILSNHVRTHTGERPHACASCPARFTQRAALRGHTRAVHHTET